MKSKLALLSVAIVLSVSAAHATSNDVQKQIDDLRAGLHDVHMNTLQKYSESWGLEDRANIAKLQTDKVDKSVFTADQARQDKALADAVTKQAATDSKQTSDLKSYADKKATSAYTTSVAHTDAKVARADADRKAGDDALNSRIDGNLGRQSDRDAGQDDHINAVQGAAQIANEKADGLAVRAYGIEKQADILDGRVGKTEVRLDTVEGGVRETNAQLAVTDSRSVKNSSDIVQLYSNGEYAQSRIDAANANIQANRNALNATNKVVSQHTEQLANHEQRLGDLERSTQNSFANIDKRIDDVKKSAHAGTAAALSSAAIPQVTEYQHFSLGAGVGGYEGEQALAVGFSSRVSSAVVLKASVTTDTQHGFGYNAGVSVGW